MNRLFVCGSLLALASLATSAIAQDDPWRPVSPSTAHTGQSGIGLRAPIADPAHVEQAGYGPALAPTRAVVAGDSNQNPQQMPLGPTLQPEKGPAPNPLMANPNPGPELKPGETYFMPFTGPVPPGAASGPTVMPTPGFVTAPGQPFQPGLGGAPCLPSQPGLVMPDNCGCNDIGGVKGWFTRFRQHDNCDPCGTIDPCACLNGCCAPRDCFWLRGEYLLWAVKGAPLPALVTSNSIPGVSPVFGVPGTQLAVGGSREDFDMRSGGRFTLGFGFPCTDNWLGLEGTFFFLPRRNESVTLSSTGVPSIGRPFINVGPGLNGFPGNQDAELVALQNVVRGSVTVNSSNELWGAEANFRMPIICGCNWKVDFLTGFRYLQLNESLQIVENLSVINNMHSYENGETGDWVGQPGRVGNFVVVDSFKTRNTFYGGQIGIDAEHRWNRCFIGGTGKLAIGAMRQSVSIDGSTTFNDGLNPGTERGGLLALPGTNIGQYDRCAFCVIPELGVRVGFYITENLRAFVGYDILYVSNVVRPGDQIDLHVNPTFLPRNGPAVGVPAPSFQLRTTDFWAQGVSVGLELRY